MNTQLKAKIEEYERELQAMKQDLATHSTRLGELHGKREELQAHLSNVLAEISQIETIIGEGTAAKTNGHVNGHANGAANGTATAPKKRGRPKKVVEEAKPTTKVAKRGRRSGESSLKHYILQTLKGQAEPLPAKVVAERVQEQGYKTSANNFHKIVLNTLGSMDEVENEFRVGYKLKG